MSDKALIPQHSSAFVRGSPLDEEDTRTGLAVPESFDLQPVVSREDVFARLDYESLKTAPHALLTATALAIAPPDALEVVEDKLVRSVEGLSDAVTASSTYVRLTAEKLTLADVEYQSSISAFAAAEAAAPRREDWKNHQHYFEALKLHERRMDRLGKLRKESFDRYERAAEIYRVAMLTSEGREILVQLAQRKSSGSTGTRIAGQPGVEIDAPDSTSTDTQVRVKIFS